MQAKKPAGGAAVALEREFSVRLIRNDGRPRLKSSADARFEYKSSCGTPHRSWNSVCDFRRIQGFWDKIHIGRRLRVLDQSFSSRRCMPIHGARAEELCSSVCEA